MKCVLFYHAFSSCWNNGNAHFLRGIARELCRLGHQVVVYEPVDGWSRLNAIRDGGEHLLREVVALFPGVSVRPYDVGFDLDEALDGADLVIVHEWNPRELVERIGRKRAQGASFLLFFHDTHHRAVTARDEFARIELDGYDGVLAFGEVLRQIYLSLGWANRAFTWHEAADTELYHPASERSHDHDVLWIGNWGDDERSAELEQFLIRPCSEARLKVLMYGVRYPSEALDMIGTAGIEYGGWLPAHHAPSALGHARLTVHVPRAPYVRALPGIPTIRMFEAMACGVPVVSAPWDDEERLFPAGAYLRVADGDEMKRALLALTHDDALAAEVRNTGLSTIAQRHTCRHRVIELLHVVNSIRDAHRPVAQHLLQEARP
jgi:spore maturation protein CgeB